jgi:vacuolar-type H+-ATPase subunit H
MFLISAKNPCGLSKYSNPSPKHGTMLRGAGLFAANYKWRRLMLKKSTRTSSLIALAAAFAVSACDSPAENATETQAEAVEEAADTQADVMEDKADAMDTQTDGMDTAKENAMEDKAQDVRAEGEAKADAMEDKADAQDK